MSRARHLLPMIFAAACSSEPTAPAAPTPSPTPPAPSGTPASRGFALFRSMRCANCHGADGRGSSGFPGAPLIIGRTADDLRTALIRPCESAGVVNCHPLKIPTMEALALDALAAYLLELANSGTQADPGPPCDDTPGRICTIAGNGVSGNKGNGGFLARDHYLFWPQNVTVDPQGRVVVTDWNNYLIRRIERTGCQELPGGGRDCPMISLIGTGQLGDSCSTAQAPVRAAAGQINHPVGVHYEAGGVFMWGWHQWKIKYFPVDADGNLGEMLCLYGNGPGLAGDGQPAGTGGRSKFDLPSGAEIDLEGNMYISDQGNLRIRRVLANADDVAEGGSEAYVSSRRDNLLETFAGGLLDPVSSLPRRTKSDYSDSGDGGPVDQATFNVQTGFEALPQMRIALDKARRRLYVADSENDRIRVIDLSVSPAVIDTYAGGGDDVVGDGALARDLKLSSPADIDLVPDGSGDLLITDTLNNCIRLVELATGRARTLAGICDEERAGYGGDGGPALEAELNNPGGAYLTADHTLYIADTLNQRIRRVSP